MILEVIKTHIDNERRHTEDLRLTGEGSDYQRAVNIGRYQAFTEMWCLIGHLESKYNDDLY